LPASNGILALCLNLADYLFIAFGSSLLSSTFYDDILIPFVPSYSELACGEKLRFGPSVLDKVPSHGHPRRFS
jgi:hypothetical protein